MEDDAAQEKRLTKDLMAVDVLPGGLENRGATIPTAPKTQRREETPVAVRAAPWLRLVGGTCATS
jgi:hypothetical protein